MVVDGLVSDLIVGNDGHVPSKRLPLDQLLRDYLIFHNNIEEPTPGSNLQSLLVNLLLYLEEHENLSFDFAPVETTVGILVEEVQLEVLRDQSLFGCLKLLQESA